MIYYVSYLKDRIGNNYLGLNIPQDIIETFLNDLKDVLNDHEFEIYTKNQKERDGGKYHLTVINVSDYNKLTDDLGMDKFINSLEPIS